MTFDSVLAAAARDWIAVHAALLLVVIGVRVFAKFGVSS